MAPGFPLAVTGPASSAHPHAPANPLTEPFGFLGWLAVLMTAFTAFVYLLDIVFLILFGTKWFAVVALLAVGNFGAATVQLIRRRTAGFQMAFAGHGVLAALAVLSALVDVARAGGVPWIIVVPAGLVLVHIVGMVFLHLSRGLFWIRD